MAESKKQIEFFFDIGSPYSYLAAHKVDEVGERIGLPVVWKPFLLGGVFKAAGNTMPAAVAAKANWMLQDLKSWAKWYGLQFNFSSRFPLNTLRTQRALVAQKKAQGHDAMRTLALALFDAYWVDDRDVSDLDEVSSIANEAGFDGAELAEAAGQQEIKDALRELTDAAVARGAFGAPAMFVGDKLYWGNDRLELLAHEHGDASE